MTWSEMKRAMISTSKTHLDRNGTDTTDLGPPTAPPASTALDATPSRLKHSPHRTRALAAAGKRNRGSTPPHEHSVRSSRGGASAQEHTRAGAGRHRCVAHRSSSDARKILAPHWVS